MTGRAVGTEATVHCLGYEKVKGRRASAGYHYVEVPLLCRASSHQVTRPLASPRFTAGVRVAVSSVRVTVSGT